MYTDKIVQQLRRRYDLRDAGAEMREMMEEHKLFFESSDDRLRHLDSVSGKMKGQDKLFFRQGFLFRAGELA